MTPSSLTSSGRGIVAPVHRALQAARPLPVGAVRLTSGMWADRQKVNRDASLGWGAEKLRAAGNVRNFQNLLGEPVGSHGHAGAADADVKNFVDSDVYKWLEAVGWESAHGELPAQVETQAEELIGLIVAAQDDDGYLNTWYQTQDASQRFSNLGFGHEMYCLGHLIQAAVAYSRVRGDTRLLEVARRFADLIVTRFGPGGREVICGHPEIEMALVELTRETGDPRYADLAHAFVDRRGRGLLGNGRFGAAYFQDRVPFRDLDTVEGHAVRALYLGAGAVDAAVETGDGSLLEAARRQWADMVATKTYLTGGVGSRHHGESFGDPFELPSDQAYCETCAAIGVAMWSWRLLLTRLDGAVGDVIERALLNAFLTGVSLDGRAFSYVNPLHVRGEHPREEWFEIACCPPNVMRTLASIEQYLATEDDDSVHLHQYASATLDAGRGRHLVVSTDYPTTGTVEVLVKASPAEAWALVARVPAWAPAPVTVSVNGQVVAAEAVANGYLRVRRTWQAGDVVLLAFDVSPRLTRASPDIDGLRGSVAIERGPLVYCLESIDLPAGASLDAMVLERGALPVDRNGELGSPPPVGLVVRTRPAEYSAWPYPPADSPAPLPDGAVEVTALPYATWGNRGTGGMRVWIPADL
ncbi:MAG: hypothetical protein JWP95_1597 [Actinotalea sp.]|nr:hypothetical protein [Actinotalea sp.]